MWSEEELARMAATEEGCGVPSIDGPHSPEATVAAARRTAEAMRFLAHATSHHAKLGVPWPSTLYSVLGALAPGVSSLATAISSMEWRLKELLREGRVDVVEGEYAGAPELAVVVAASDLQRALEAANALEDALRSAQGRMTWMGTPYSEDESEGGDR